MNYGSKIVFKNIYQLKAYLQSIEGKSSRTQKLIGRTGQGFDISSRDSREVLSNIILDLIQWIGYKLTKVFFLSAFYRNIKHGSNQSINGLIMDSCNLN